MTAATRDQGTDSMPGGLSRRELLMAAAVGLAAHVVWALLITSSVEAGDAKGYHQIALNLAFQGTFSDSVAPPIVPYVGRAPLLPLVASLLYRVFGPHLWPLHILHSLLDVGGALVVAMAVARLAPRAGRLALWLLVLVPFDIMPAGAMWSEPLTMASLGVGTALPLLSQRRSAWALAGVGLGLAALGRDIYLPMAGGFVAFFLVFRRFRPPVGWLHVALLCAATALTIAPWTVRNCASTSVCTPVSKGLMGFNLWVGTWERDVQWTQNGALVPPPYAYDSDAQQATLLATDSALATDAKYRAVAIDRITGRPLTTLKVWLRRWPRLWVGTRSDLFQFSPSWLQPGAPLWYLMKASFFGLNLLLLLAGAAGVVVAWRRGSRLLWLAVPIVYNTLVYLPFHNTEARYTQPVYPLLIAFASVALTAAIDRLRAQRDRQVGSLPARGEG